VYIIGSCKYGLFHSTSRNRLQIDDYLKEAMSPHIENGYLVNYDLSHDDKILYYKIASEEDKPQIQRLMNNIASEILIEFKVKVEARLRL